MAPQFHTKPFDDATLVKLDIYKEYLREWLPVFLSPTIYKTKTINVFDFFSGPGCDANGVKGSPIITLECLLPYIPNIINNGLNVNVFFNDKSAKNVAQLNKEIDDRGFRKKPFNIHVTNSDFHSIFSTYLLRMPSGANLIFMDQFGVKQVDSTIFQSLVKLKVTDILFFISSSFFNRFADDEDFNILGIKKNDIKSKGFSSVHRVVLDPYRKLLSTNKYHLAPFSIKKGSNIYGLIFGSNHIRGIDKFLHVCWDKDKISGEANFDIDSDQIDTFAPTLFNEFNQSKKVNVFQDLVRAKIIEGTLSTDKDVYLFSIENGFIATEHAKPVILELKKAKLIECKNPS